VGAVAGRPARRHKRSGTYRAYRPDELRSRSSCWSRRFNAARQSSIGTTADGGPGDAGLEGLARFLLRWRQSRRPASRAYRCPLGRWHSPSWQRMKVSRRQLHAQCAAGRQQHHGLRKACYRAGEGARGVIAGVDALHRALLPDERLHGLRGVQNWIGGSDWQSSRCRVRAAAPRTGACSDAGSLEYASGGTHAPLVQLRSCMRSSKTIHPYVDGNGRVGRALLHHGADPSWSDAFGGSADQFGAADAVRRVCRALTAIVTTVRRWRRSAAEALSSWMELFLESTSIAVDSSWPICRRVGGTPGRLGRALSLLARRAGGAERPRAGSAVARLIELLPEAPVMTARRSNACWGCPFRPRVRRRRACRGRHRYQATD